MTQIGLNQGPRHARISSLAISFTGKHRLDSDDTKALNDKAVIAAAGMFWLIAKSALPKEIIAATEAALVSNDMPRMATPHVKEGKLASLSLSSACSFLYTGLGFKFELKGKLYHFAQAERSPPETYMTRGYDVYV